MGVLYQLTFIVAIALVGVVITIFVFAVAQLGRAAEISASQQQDILSRSRTVNLERIASIQKSLEGANGDGTINQSELLNQIYELTKESNEFELEKRRVREKVERLKVKGGVLIPGAFFLATLVLNGLAALLADTGNYVSAILWVVSTVTLGFGIWNIYRNLKVVEEVTTTPREPSSILPEAVREALLAVEAQKRPELELKFEGQETPQTFEAGSEVDLCLGLTCTKGDCAENIKVFFAIEPTFSFINVKNTNVFGEEADYKGYKFYVWEPENLLKGLHTVSRPRIGTPTDAGNYKFVYWIACKGFNAGPIEVEVQVDIPF